MNVLLALLVKKHEHHKYAAAWFGALEPGEAALCRVVQLAVIRLLSNKSVMSDGVISPAEAWQMTADLCEDERVILATEPAELEPVLKSLLATAKGSSAVFVDAYLAAFAIASSMRLTTLDRGFQQFAGLDLELLAS